MYITMGDGNVRESHESLDGTILPADDPFWETHRESGMQVVIPPKKNRLVQRHYDKDLYKFRHLVENAIQMFKLWRGIATRYAKNTASFLAAVRIRCISIWLNILA